MNIKSLEKLRCPKTKGKLKLDKNTKQDSEDILEGTVVNENGLSFNIKNGIIDFVTEQDLTGDAAFARNYYAGIADTYDDNVDITFTLYNEDESQVRNQLVDLLGLNPSDSILEISAGTGKDSEIISQRLVEEGELFCLDISPDMLKKAKKRLKNTTVPIELVCGTAVSLPFNDNQFDRLFCFAGVGHFPDIKTALSEMARVVKPGGKVVFCEKNVPLWLRNTEYGKILINNNPMFADEVPLKYIPVDARNVCIRWINGNVHYVVDYEVGEGEPTGNFNLELPGARGGSFNSRYYGKLEGVSPETKELALKAREKLGISMHKWIDDLIMLEAKKILNQDN